MAVQNGDLQKIRELIGNDPEALSEALAAPVGLDRHAVYHIKNYGSAMAPVLHHLEPVGGWHRAGRHDEGRRG